MKVDAELESAQSRVRANALANYLGRGWTLIVSLIALPLYMGYLGREAFGLIGVFAIIQAWALIFDFGLTPTLNREMVRARSGKRTWDSMADLVRSIELSAIVVAICLVLAIFFCSDLVAIYWLRSDALPVSTVAHAVSLMGLLAAMRWMEQIYRGSIQGSEDQVWLNALQIVTESARWLGAIAVLHFVSADVIDFFCWNLAVSIASLLVLRVRLHSFLRAKTNIRPRFRSHELHAVRGFASGMFFSAILAFLLTQADKLVAGKFLPLAEFGLYALVGTAASGLLQLVQPINVAILPRLTSLVEHDAKMALNAEFDAASQWLAVVIMPFALAIIFLPESTLLAWTGREDVVRDGSLVLALLMSGTFINALMNAPYMLQLAHGWTSLANKINAAGLVIWIPCQIWATIMYGATGAAGSIFALNLVSSIVMTAFVVRRLLDAETGTWLRQAVMQPLGIGLTTAIAFRLILPTELGRVPSFLALAGCSATIFLLVVTSTPYPRKQLHSLIKCRFHLGRSSRASDQISGDEV